MADLVLMLAAAVGLVSVVVAARRSDARRLAASARVYRLAFPKGTEAAAVTAFLLSLASVRRPGPGRLVSAPTVTIETTAGRDTGIGHHLTVPASFADVLLGRLAVALPGVRITPNPHHRPPEADVATRSGTWTASSSTSCPA